MYLHANSSDLENVIAQCRYEKAKGVIITKAGYSAIIGERGYMLSGDVFKVFQDIVISLPELTHIANISQRLAMKLSDGTMWYENVPEYAVTINQNKISVTGTSHVATYTTKYTFASAEVVEQIMRIADMESNRSPDYAMPVKVFKHLTKKHKSNLAYKVEGDVLLVTSQRNGEMFEYFAGFARVDEVPQFPRQSLRGLELITTPISEGIILFFLVEGGCHVVVVRDSIVYARTRIELHTT